MLEDMSPGQIEAARAEWMEAYISKEPARWEKIKEFINILTVIAIKRAMTKTKTA